MVSLAAPAWAAGGAVTVNPSVARPGRYLLVAPDSTRMRFVPALLQPGQKSGPINLHMPTARERAAARQAQTRQAEAPKPKPAPQVASAAPPPEPHVQAPKASPKEAPKQASAAPPARTPARSGYTSRFAGPGSVFNGPALTLHPKDSTKDSAAPAKKQASSEPPVKVAKAAPAPESSLPGTSRRSVILFAKDATKPMPSALDQIQLLAGDLNAAMTRPSSRIELRAYGGARGDKGSDARRLSLKRALAIRQVLIDDGVNAGRIDVRAMGGAENGPADRVDIYVRA